VKALQCVPGHADQHHLRGRSSHVATRGRAAGEQR
jgi:hypothetical protein